MNFVFSNNLRKKAGVRVFLFFLTLSFCWSCGVVLSPKPTLPKPIFEPYPLTIVLYLSQDFKNQTGVVDPAYNWTMSLGTASSDMILETLKAMFNHVYVVGKQDDIPREFAGILEPTIDAFGLDYSGSFIKITYAFTLYDNKRQAIKKLIIYGKGSNKDIILVNMFENMTERAIKDVMAQFMVKFQEDALIRKWLQANGITQNRSRKFNE